MQADVRVDDPSLMSDILISIPRFKVRVLKTEQDLKPYAEKGNEVCSV